MENIKPVTKVKWITLPRPPDYLLVPVLVGCFGVSVSVLANEPLGTGFFGGLSVGLAGELASIYIPRVAGGRSRRGNSRRQAPTGAFAYSIPAGGKVRIEPETGGWLSVGGFRDFIAPRKRPGSLRPTRPPVFANERVFWSLGVELSGSVVETFLRSAWRLRAKGKGLSARRWTGKNNVTLPNIWEHDFYWPTMNLLYEAETVTGRQLIIEEAGSNRKRLAKYWRETYNILWYVETLKVYHPPTRKPLLSRVFGN